ncbi:hypothetical protein PVAND_003130 [Polypedilum vanderplanki]|uniref:GMP phosphodiesterase delta subunit domain-containing protein n=1 Tax=Polypedilum vanderplanki TaxID=319348 RepID=A0A9J6BU08_POLVA|nr:hypothetical protein PVAND_003130 [Polypedilum vanderplanki]
MSVVQKQINVNDEIDNVCEDLEVKLKYTSNITPEDVLKLTKITDNFLCSNNNEYQIEFTRFKIRDLETDTVLFDISKDPNMPETNEITTTDDKQQDGTTEDSGRFVRYLFSATFLKLKHVGATVEFQVGNKDVKNFRMIERHFFKDRLLKTFDFNFGYCIPNSKNTCEHIYEFPTLPQDLIDQMIACPFETRSDSFYFVDNQLVLHNKADYSYNG